MKKEYKMIVRYGEYDKPSSCTADKVEQLAQGWFRITKLPYEKNDIYVHTSKLLSITYEEMSEDVW